MSDLGTRARALAEEFADAAVGERNNQGMYQYLSENYAESITAFVQDEIATLRQQLADLERELDTSNSAHRATGKLLAQTGQQLAEAQSRSDRFQRERAELFDQLTGTPCAQIRWEQERGNLRQQLAEAREALPDDAMLGELIYRVVYEPQGGKWEANESKPVWTAKGADLRKRLRALKEQESNTEDWVCSICDGGPGNYGTCSCPSESRGRRLSPARPLNADESGGE